MIVYLVFVFGDILDPVWAEHLDQLPLPTGCTHTYKLDRVKKILLLARAGLFRQFLLFCVICKIFIVTSN